MILIQVVGYWLAFVALVVTLDVGPSYLAERSAKKAKEKEDQKKVEEILDVREMMKRGVAPYRRARRIELGLSVEHTPADSKRQGAHRRVAA